MRNIPNALTCTRIVLALLFPWVAQATRLPLMLGALATEYLDGALARRFGWRSALGQLLDPIADKLLFAIVAGTFILEGRIGWLELVALGIRDLVVAVGAAGLALQGKWGRFNRMEPRYSGKVTTALQYLAFFSVLTGNRIPLVLLLLVFLAGTLAALQYCLTFRPRGTRSGERGGSVAA